jgi:hypothetical protein
MLIYGEEEPRVEVEVERGITAHGLSAMPGFTQSDRKGAWDYPNSHDYFECAFCHLGTPSVDDKEHPGFVMPVRDLCAPCHPDKTMLHIYSESNLARNVKVEALLKHDLPTEEGEVLCLTCHQMHNAIYSIRPSYIKAEVAERPVDPHGQKLYCLLCHEGKLDDPTVVTIRKGGDALALCSECHKGLASRKDHHPTEVTLGEETWKLGFVNFPFSEGRLSCLTCHDEVCYIPRDPKNPAFLREGPYASESEFCFRCHTENKAEFVNPHDQFHSVGLLKVDTCLICHKSVPDRTGEAEGSSELIEEVTYLCKKCHSNQSPHPAVNHLIPMPRKMLQRKIAYEDKHKASLPLRGEDEIICTTCHNPHDKGVLRGELGVGAGEIKSLRLPDYREICAPCHGRY